MIQYNGKKQAFIYLLKHLNLTENYLWFNKNLYQILLEPVPTLRAGCIAEISGLK